MFAVEIYAAVRRFVFVEGKSRREAARVFGLSRDTIAKMCRYSAPPGYVRSKAPERPKLGLLVPVIDAILESDKTAPPKQRHTAKRIFERLRIEHGFAGGYTALKDYVRLARTRSREVFVPLAHPPGHAQVDFGECIGVIGGVRMKLHVFCFDLPHSDACFIKAYPAETTEAFLDGHIARRALTGFIESWTMRSLKVLPRGASIICWWIAPRQPPAVSRFTCSIILGTLWIRSNRTFRPLRV
jgi:transposase